MHRRQDELHHTKIDYSLWRKILVHAKPYYPKLGLIVLFMGLSALLDVIFPLLTRHAIDHFIGLNTTEGLGGFIVLFSAVALLQGVAIYLFLYYCGQVEAGVCYLIRKAGYQKLQELSFSYYDTMPVGFLMTRMTSDAQRLADTIGWSILDLVWGFLFLLFCSIQMLIINWKLALILLAILPLLAIISWQFQKRILQSYRMVRKTNSEITSAFNEGIMGAKTTKTLVREELNNEEFKILSTKMNKSAVRAASLSSLFLPIVISISSIATAIILTKSGYDVLSGVLTLGTMQLFITYSIQFFQPVQDLARVFAELQSSQAAAERVMSLLETEPEIVDTPEVIAQFGDNFHPKKENWPPFKGDITFDHVSFQYKDGEKVLDDFSLKVKAGQTIALAGETG
ncbi:MAG: ABC transporter ATP-binding protein, partial [Clostridiales bacterium]|nr:ABC transporter ATP-binding protein [Clostridiales bacterium]